MLENSALVLISKGSFHDLKYRHFNSFRHRIAFSSIFIKQYLSSRNLVRALELKFTEFVSFLVLNLMK